jgi:glycosyltransferase involved in cell wall biosynthesis
VDGKVGVMEEQGRKSEAFEDQAVAQGSSKDHILYLSYDGMTDPLGQSQVLPYLKGLSREGYQFHLISFEKPDRYAQHRTIIEKICQESGISWYPIMYTKRPPVLSTLWDIRKMNRKSLEITRSNNIGLIHCRSYISALIGLKMKRKNNIPFLFDMRGFWADERVDGKIWNIDNPLFKKIYAFFKKKEKQFFIESDHVISLTEEGKKEIKIGIVPDIDPDKITVIPCCVDTELFDPSTIKETERKALKERIGITEKDSVMGYVGSIGTWYMLPEMLEFFKHFSDKTEDSKFLFVTPESETTILLEAEKFGLDKTKLIVTRCLHHEVPLYVSLFDLGIFFIRPSYSKKASSPTKQGELMAMGIPVVCNSGVGDSAFVVEKYQSGIIINDLTKISFNEEMNKEWNKELIRKGGEDFYGLKKGTALYSAIYSKLIS